MGFIIEDRYMSTDPQVKASALDKCRFMYEGFGYWPLTKQLRLGEQWGWVVSDKLRTATHGKIGSRHFHTHLAFDFDADIYPATNIEVEVDGKRYGGNEDYVFIYAWRAETFSRNQSPFRTTTFQLLIYCHLNDLSLIVMGRSGQVMRSIEEVRSVQVLWDDSIHMLHR